MPPDALDLVAPHFWGCQDQDILIEKASMKPAIGYPYSGMPSDSEKLEPVLRRLAQYRPDQAALLMAIYLDNKPQILIAAERGLSQPSISTSLQYALQNAFLLSHLSRDWDYHTAYQATRAVWKSKFGSARRRELAESSMADSVARYLTTGKTYDFRCSRFVRDSTSSANLMVKDLLTIRHVMIGRGLHRTRKSTKQGAGKRLGSARSGRLVRA